MSQDNFARTLSIIHSSLLLGLVIFAGFVFWHNPNFTPDMNSNDIFIYLVPLTAVAGYFGSNYVFQNSIQTIDGKDGLQDKLNGYQVASILKYMLIEGPAILALFAYYLNSNALHLVVACCLIIYLFSLRPTKKKIIDDLKLSVKQQDQFNSKNTATDL